MIATMKRREFITLIGGAAAWPLMARAHQRTMPVIGVLTSMAAGDAPQLLVAFRQGLKDTGFVEVKDDRMTLSPEQRAACERAGESRLPCSFAPTG
jgi:hypothetical protein